MAKKGRVRVRDFKERPLIRPVVKSTLGAARIRKAVDAAIKAREEKLLQVVGE